MNISILRIFFWSLLLLPFNLSAANYYVTQSGAGSHDGTSASNAWSVSDFNGTTKPTGGDTIIFTGTLSTNLTPSTNGTSSAQLLLDLKGATVNAQVAVNGRSYLTLSGGTTASSRTTSTAIKLSNCNYITVDGWKYESSDINAWPHFVSSEYNNNLTISNCTAKNCAYAWFGNNDTNVRITGCDFLSSQNGTTNQGNQTDLVKGGGCQGFILEKSKINLRAPGSGNAGADGSWRHNDAIQTYATGGSSGKSPSNWIIRYNWIENSNTSGDGNSSWLMTDSMGGYCKIYSNVWVCPENARGINNGLRMGSAGKPGTEHTFINNTVIKRTMPNGAITYNDNNKPAGQGNGTLYCVNNIAYCPLTGSGQGFTANNLGSAPISNNFWYNFSGRHSSVPPIPPGSGGSSTADPKFVNFTGNDFSLAADSPCRGAGTNSPGSEYNQGIAPGSTWPNPTIVTRSGAWDVGAYVMNAGPASSPTPTPSPTPPPYPTPTPAPKFAVGDYVGPIQTVNVRATPGGALLGTQDVDAIGIVKSGPVVADLNSAPVNWYEITWTADPTDGWSGDDNLILAVAPSPTPTPPEPTPTPTPSPGPSPTPTPGPTATPCPSFTDWNAALHTELSNCPSQTDLDNWLNANPPYLDGTGRRRGPKK